MDIHSIQGDQCTHVMATHQDEGDEGPLQLISSERLAYYMTLERALLAFVESIVTVLPSPSAPDRAGVPRPAE